MQRHPIEGDARGGTKIPNQLSATTRRSASAHPLASSGTIEVIDRAGYLAASLICAGAAPSALLMPRS